MPRSTTAAAHTAAQLLRQQVGAALVVPHRTFVAGKTSYARTPTGKKAAGLRQATISFAARLRARRLKEVEEMHKLSAVKREAAIRKQEAEKRVRRALMSQQLAKEIKALTPPSPNGTVTIAQLAEDSWVRLRPQLNITAFEFSLNTKR